MAKGCICLSLAWPNRIVSYKKIQTYLHLFLVELIYIDDAKKLQDPNWLIESL